MHRRQFSLVTLNCLFFSFFHTNKIIYIYTHIYTCIFCLSRINRLAWLYLPFFQMATGAIGGTDAALEFSRVAAETTQPVPKLKPIASFGLITDIHHADHDDKWNYAGTFLRRYRNSSKLVQQASEYWCNETFPIAFVIQLGDLIDGFCQIDQTSSRDLQTILEQFESIANACPIYHIWGNHEFYNFTREELLHGPLCSFETKDIAPGHYGTIQVCSNLRVIAIDTYELSLLGIEAENEAYSQALDLLKKNNPNENLNDPTGLVGFEQRFIRLNGGVTSRQLIWLRKQLQAAKDRNEKVIVVGKQFISISKISPNHHRIETILTEKLVRSIHSRWLAFLRWDSKDVLYIEPWENSTVESVLFVVRRSHSSSSQCRRWTCSALELRGRTGCSLVIRGSRSRVHRWSCSWRWLLRRSEEDSSFNHARRGGMRFRSERFRNGTRLRGSSHHPRLWTHWHLSDWLRNVNVWMRPVLLANMFQI